VRIEQRDENTSAATLTPVGDTPVASFSPVLKNRSFLLLWLAQLLSQSVFNAANYGVIAIVTAITHSTVMVGLAIGIDPKRWRLQSLFLLSLVTPSWCGHRQVL